jgi:hypothetical protein
LSDKKLAWPKTPDQLREAGYAYSSEGSCKGCGAPIIWAKTPKGANMPLAATEGGYQPHWADCPNRADFKRV